MNFKKVILSGAIVFAINFSAFSAAVSFSSPQPWLTLRNKDLSVKMVIDTAITKSKAVKVKAYISKNGGKRVIASKTIKGGETSGELIASLGNMPIGGKNHIGVEWSVPGLKDVKGALAPVGYYPLENISKENVEANKLSGAYNVDSFKSDVEVNKSLIDFAWTTDALIVAAKVKSETITVKFDAKNGKNAFPAFADRCLTLSSDTALTITQYPNRSITKKGVDFEKKEWKNEIKIVREKDVIVATIPFHDLGMIATEGRIFGITVFDKDNKTYPVKANKAIPGTWGNIILK